MKKIFAANWKLYKTPQQTRDYFKEFLPLVGSIPQAQLVFFPPATSLEAASASVRGARIEWGSQNCWFEAEGAFTGETSAQVVKELGGQWTLVGHSERRKIYSETLEWTGKKVAFAQSLGLKPMLCIGETLQEREAGRTDEINLQQLEAGLAHASKDKPLAIAYEPVWAIGTGKVATADQVQQAHMQIKKFLNQLGFSADTPVLYGGSVKPENAVELINLPAVDGFLVGGASLVPASFIKIANCIS